VYVDVLVYTRGLWWNYIKSIFMFTRRNVDPAERRAAVCYSA